MVLLARITVFLRPSSVPFIPLPFFSASARLLHFSSRTLRRCFVLHSSFRSPQRFFITIPRSSRTLFTVLLLNSTFVPYTIRLLPPPCILFTFFVLLPPSTIRLLPSIFFYSLTFVSYAPLFHNPPFPSFFLVHNVPSTFFLLFTFPFLHSITLYLSFIVLLQLYTVFFSPPLFSYFSFILTINVPFGCRYVRLYFSYLVTFSYTSS